MSSAERRRRSRSRSPFQRRQRREDGKPSRSEAGKSLQRRKSGGREYGSHENGDHRLDRRHDNSLNPERIRHQEHRERSNRKRDVGNSRARQRYRMEGAEREPVELNEQSGQGTNNESIPDKDGPNYDLSGKLTEYTNTYKGVVIKYNEPPEARVPKTRWRIYPFKGEEALSVMYIHRQSAYLLGRQRHIVDIAIDHPSCSKQHAVLQYRLVDYHKPDGSTGRKVKPYIIDLDSINGTYLNNQRVDPRRFYELKEKDVLKFGFSTREYVILTEKSQESEHSAANADEDETTP